MLIRSSSCSRLADRDHRAAQVALDPAAELGDQPDRLERQHRRQLPAVAGADRRQDEQADGPLDLADRLELLAGEREPRVRADPPAAQIAGVEPAGVREHPARELVRAALIEPERTGERAALIELVGPHRRVIERDRQPRAGRARAARRAHSPAR